MKYVYRASDINSQGHMSHALSAYEQRKNYDSAKRRERYLRDKAEGKTGFKGVLARTSNPFGNYSSVYYDPQKAHDYYMRNRKLANPAGNRAKEEAAAEEAAAEEAAEDGGSGGGSGGGGGAGGAGGGGGAGNAAAQAQAREEANNRIQALQEAVNAKIQTIQDKISANAENAQTKRQAKKEEATEKMQAEREKRVENVESTTEGLQKQRDLKLDPIREENARLRGKLDSMNPNSEEGIELRRKLAANAKQSMKACADYTDSLVAQKTKFSNEMNQNLAKIRKDLNNCIDKSSKKQQATAKKLRDKITSLRTNLNKEIAAIRKAVSDGTYSSGANYGSTSKSLDSGGSSASGRLTRSNGSGASGRINRSGPSSTVVSGVVAREIRGNRRK